ncbi:helix-turn-helix protein [Stackebrandtia endophytica]|uniref:Helix-turn-helix protein n=1 Tax=Stackebrandtia endophytica TaxID=1496996 RepID=A0A543AR74_9ACTN|nr:helix-turn-helix transcriptional regulator [Stackebrandtia endophytica]TQL75064.1 helix-turn-helix protein [Stackebrandtia endophytica]
MIRRPLTPDQRSRGSALGETLRQARGQISLADAAATAGISPETLRKIETGRLPSPSFFTVAALCHAYGLSLDQLSHLGDPRR